MLQVLSILAPLASWILNNYLLKEGEKNKDMANYLRWIELMGAMGVMKQEARRKAVDQVQRIEELWKTKGEVSGES